jgi:AAHS family 4-hydroxybenzoate transporter-like MFS transporter
MGQNNAVEVQQFIDTQPFSRFQKAVLLLCLLVVAVDGIDTAMIGFIAPAIRAEWHLSAAALAPLFGAGMFGLMSGALLFGPLADRLGRKTILVFSVLFFGLASLASMFSNDLTTLTVLRFLTGIGLGGAMPNAVTLTSEYCPQARRSRLVTLMFCGFTLGSALGGLLAAQIMPMAGWRGALCMGGVLPLLLAPVLHWRLSESLRFLVLRNRSRDAIAAIVARIAPNLPAQPELVVVEQKIQAPIRALFRDGLALGTVLLWVCFFNSLLIVYLLSSWLPTLLHGTGASLSKASAVSAMFMLGGTVGAVLLGRMMDRFGSFLTLALSYLFGAGFVLLCGFSSGPGQLGLLVFAVFGVGFCISGGQVGGNALSAWFYPTGNRSTGVSWANAAGRCGSIVGSMSGGWMLSMHMEMQTILALLAIPALISALSIALLGYFQNKAKRYAAAYSSAS